MKTFVSIPIFFLCIVTSAPAYAQLDVIRRARQKTEKRTGNEVDKKIDKELDKIDEQINRGSFDSKLSQPYGDVKIKTTKE